MAQKKKAKSKTVGKAMGKKDLKKTKGGLNFAVSSDSAMKWPENQVNSSINISVDPASLQRFK